ncbi:MAG: IscA/HesB family protein [Desulfovibrionaceae bacterium]|nr:IscA/HesB family protein [Desulfovibrionaceae bacterium]
MLTLTENATKELKAFFADKAQSPIRIYLAPGGCGGPRLGLALDDPRDEDAVLDQDGFTFCVEKNLWEQIGGVTIDLSYMGFTVEPANPLPAPAGGSACGSCCSSCCGH